MTRYVCGIGPNTPPCNTSTDNRVTDMRIWFWVFTDLKTTYRFCDCLATREIRRTCRNVGIFYVVSDRYSTEHREWKLNRKIRTLTTIYIYVKFTRDYYLSIEIQLEMKFVWSDQSSYTGIQHLTKIIVMTSDYFHDEIRWQPIWKHQRPLKSQCKNGIWRESMVRYTIYS